MKKRVLIGLAATAVIAAVIIIPRHMSKSEATTSITAEATNPGNDSSSEETRETSLTNEESSETVKSTAATTAATNASSEKNTGTEETTATATTTTTKRVILKNELPVEELEKWLESYMEAPTTLIPPPETTAVATTNKTETQTTATTAKSTDNAETTTTTEKNGLYKDIVVKMVMVKPEQEVDGLLLREDVPQWQLIVEYREECDGVLTTKLLAAPQDYFDPMNPAYKSENWYFSTKPYVKIGEEYYKPTAVLDALIKKFKIDVDTLKPYEALALMVHTPNVEESESATEGEDGMVLYDEEGNEYIVVNDES